MVSAGRSLRSSYIKAAPGCQIYLNFDSEKISETTLWDHLKMKEQFCVIMKQNGILRCTDFYSPPKIQTTCLNKPNLPQSTLIRTLFRFVNLYEILDHPLCM